jgi:hypothetical protein
MTVAKLAWEQLNARQRLAAYETLQSLPYLQKFMAERPLPEALSGKGGEMEWTFLNAATWPDWLRDFAPPPFGRRPDPDIYQYHHGPWHYINFPVIATEDADSFAKQPLDPTKKEQETILTALQANFEQLQVAAATYEQKQKKALALAWLLHLVGDLHQPLHSAAFFSVKDFPKGDLGGNAWWVKDGEEGIKLHAYWDNLPGPEPGFGVEPFKPSATAKAYEQVQTNVARLTREGFRRDRFAAELKRTGFREWADESLELARARAYAFQGKRIGGLAFLSPNKLTDAEIKEKTAAAPPLPKGYAALALQTADVRMALAGHRLADLLGVAFPAKAPNP